MVEMFRRLGLINRRVLLIDTDSQAHATLVTTGRNNYGAKDSLYAVLTAERGNAPQLLLDLVQPSTWDPDLHVLPASAMLETAERELFGSAGAPYRLADPLSQISGQYSDVFRVMTAYHALHALVIGYMMFNALKKGRAGAYTSLDNWDVEGAAKLWYFVVVAWILFYVVLYVI